MAPVALTRPRLRVGLFVSSRRQPRALVEAFAEISRSNFAEVVLIAVSHQAQPSLPWRWRLYRWLDRCAFATPADASEEVDLTPFLVLSPVIEASEVAGVPRKAGEFREEIGRLHLDVAFVLGDFDSEAIEGLARYGLWRIGYGLWSEALPGLEGFREVAEGRPVSCVGLSVRRAGRREQLICESRSRTAPFSLTRNREKLIRRAARFPGRMLSELHRSGDAALNLALSQTPVARRNTVDTPLEVTPSVVHIGQRIIRRGLQKLTRVDQWFMAFRYGAAGEVGEGDQNQATGPFRCLMPPRDRFWADPFALQWKGHHYLFFEELIFAKGKAHIAVMEVRRDGRCSPPTRVLERPYHLSYPFLIEDQGTLFMVPETGQNGTVELYRCVHFPDRWVLDAVLLRAPCCVDASFYKSGGRWWMFVNIGADETEVHDELHLYYADSLRGEWHAHARNPIKSDVRSARSAGGLYQSGGQLFRPSQIGAPLYGSGISINQVLALTPEVYQEEEVERIVSLDTDRVLGVHTFNRSGELTVIDGFVRRKRWGTDQLEFFEPVRIGPEQPLAQRSPDTRADLAQAEEAEEEEEEKEAEEVF